MLGVAASRRCRHALTRLDRTVRSESTLVRPFAAGRPTPPSFPRMRHSPGWRLALGALVWVLGTGCGSGGSVPADTPPDTNQSTGDSATPTTLPTSPLGTWDFVGGSSNGGTIDLPPGQRITLTVEPASVSGRSLCHRYSMATGLADDQMRVAQLARERLDDSCSEATLTVDDAIFAVLASGEWMNRSGGILTIGSALGELTFKPAGAVDENLLLGTTWAIERLLVDGAANAVGGEPTVVLSSSGTVTVETGCRSVSGSFLLDSGEFTIAQLDGDPCTDDTRAQQDAALTGMLMAGFRPVITDDELLIEARGGLGLIASPVSGAAPATSTP